MQIVQPAGVGIPHTHAGTGIPLGEQTQELMMRKAPYQAVFFIPSRLVDEGVHDDLSGGASRISGALQLLPAEIPQGNICVRAVERHAEMFEPAQNFRCVGGQVSYGIRVGKIDAAAHCVREVVLRAVALAHRVQRCIDAALRKHGLSPFRGLEGDQPAGMSCFSKCDRSR